MLKIILIGKMGAGKDEVGRYLVGSHNFRRFAFAAKLKEIAKDLFPEQFEQGKPRKLLQDLGAKMREIEKDCWTNYLMRKVGGLECNVVITDCRYKNELEIAERYGFTPVRMIVDDEKRHARLVLRDKVVSKDTFSHMSETDLDNVFVEYELENNGSVNDLYRSIDLLISDLGAR